VKVKLENYGLLFWKSNGWKWVYGRIWLSYNPTDDYSQYMEKKNVWNHQPAKCVPFGKGSINSVGFPHLSLYVDVNVYRREDRTIIVQTNDFICLEFHQCITVS
jgi:hypothetical protein